MKVRRKEEEAERYPMLAQFFGCYLHQGWPEESGTPEQAVDAAIADYPLEARRQIRREIAALLADYQGDDPRLRAVLNDGLGVNVYFKKPAEARAFCEGAERKLMQSIRAAFRR